MKTPTPEGTAFLWFPNQEEYSQYQKFCEDVNPMCEYEEWLHRATNAEKRFNTKIIKVYANVEAFAEFCRRCKIKPDADGRGSFAAFLSKQIHEQRN